MRVQLSNDRAAVGTTKKNILICMLNLATGGRGLFVFVVAQNIQILSPAPDNQRLGIESDTRLAYKISSANANEYY